MQKRGNWHRPDSVEGYFKIGSSDPANNNYLKTPKANVISYRLSEHAKAVQEIKTGCVFNSLNLQQLMGARKKNGKRRKRDV